MPLAWVPLACRRHTGSPSLNNISTAVVKTDAARYLRQHHRDLRALHDYAEHVCPLVVLDVLGVIDARAPGPPVVLVPWVLRARGHVEGEAFERVLLLLRHIEINDDEAMLHKAGPRGQLLWGNASIFLLTLGGGQSSRAGRGGGDCTTTVTPCKFCNATNRTTQLNLQKPLEFDACNHSFVEKSRRRQKMN